MNPLNPFRDLEQQVKKAAREHRLLYSWNSKDRAYIITPLTQTLPNGKNWNVTVLQTIFENCVSSDKGSGKWTVAKKIVPFESFSYKLKMLYTPLKERAYTWHDVCQQVHYVAKCHDLILTREHQTNNYVITASNPTYELTEEDVKKYFTPCQSTFVNGYHFRTIVRTDEIGRYTLKIVKTPKAWQLAQRAAQSRELQLLPDPSDTNFSIIYPSYSLNRKILEKLFAPCWSIEATSDNSACIRWSAVIHNQSCSWGHYRMRIEGDRY